MNENSRTGRAGRRMASGAAAMSLLLALGTPLPVASASTETLAQFSGTFRGTGSVRRSPDNAAESVRCRITAKLAGGGLTLEQSGTCAVPGQKFEIASRLVLDPRTNRLSGDWTDPADGSAASVSGRKEGERLMLTIVGRDPRTMESRTRWLVIEPTGAGYRMTSTAPGSKGGRFVAGTIEFTK